MRLNDVERRADLVADSEIAPRASEVPSSVDESTEIEDTGFTITEADILRYEGRDAEPFDQNKAAARCVKLNLT